MIPEPFSITTGVLGIIGFLNLARLGTQALYRDVKAYRATSQDVVDFYKDLKFAEYRMNLWKRIWLIQPETHEEFPVFLWGEGWEHIKHQIDKVERVSGDINGILLPYLHEYLARGPGQVADASKAKTLGADEIRRIAVRKHDADRVSSELWWGQKIAYALSKSEGLKAHLSKYPDLFVQLYHISEEIYFNRHDVQKNISNQSRRDTATAKMLVLQARKTRGASWALHHYCRSVGDGDIELELSLVNWKVGVDARRPFNAGIPKRLRYYLTLPPATLSTILHNSPDALEDALVRQSDPPSQLEIIVERRNKTPADCNENFRDVCAALAQGRSSYIRCTTDGWADEDQPSAFSFWRSSDPVVDSGRQDSRLADLLNSSATGARDEDLSFRERIEIAYRVAECCLLLLGTSWLSNLSSYSITRAHSPGSDARYRLMIGRCLGNQDGYLDLQTKRLGQLLREIALGTGVGASYDRETELSLLTRELGVQYQGAIDFCYKHPVSKVPPTLDSRQDHEYFYTGILVDFFDHVVLPLAKLHEASKPVSPQDRPEQDHKLSFLPKTYAEGSTAPLAGLIPTLSTSTERPTTFLGALGATMRALSIRSASTLGTFGKSNVIVYYVSTQKFVKLARDNVPDHAHRLEIPKTGMTYDIELPVPNLEEKKPLATLKFEELGFSVSFKRLLGKINEIFIVDDLFGALGPWDLEEESGED